MPFLAERVRRTIRRHDLIPHGGRVLVALSGGPDSVALLALLHTLTSDGDFVVAGLAHLNHQLRGREADEDLCVSTEDAYVVVRRLALEEGLLVGISGGAALAVCLRLAEGLREGVIVTVFPDSADKYLSERFWETPS